MKNPTSFCVLAMAYACLLPTSAIASLASPPNTEITHGHYQVLSPPKVGPIAGRGFGWSLARSDVSREGVLVVGDPDFRRAHVYEAIPCRVSGSPIVLEPAKLLTNCQIITYKFGQSVAADSNTILISLTEVYSQGKGSQKRSGVTTRREPNRVCVFERERSGTVDSWKASGYLELPETNWSPDELAIAGNTAVVADHRSRRVYVFHRSNGAWYQTTELAGDDGNGIFGCAVALHEDTLVVGDSLGGGGAVYVYKRIPWKTNKTNNGWPSWDRVAKISGRHYGSYVDVWVRAIGRVETTWIAIGSQEGAHVYRLPSADTDASEVGCYSVAWGLHAVSFYKKCSDGAVRLSIATVNDAEAHVFVLAPVGGQRWTAWENVHSFTVHQAERVVLSGSALTVFGTPDLANAVYFFPWL